MSLYNCRKTIEPTWEGLLGHYLNGFTWAAQVTTWCASFTWCLTYIYITNSVKIWSRHELQKKSYACFVRPRCNNTPVSSLDSSHNASINVLILDSKIPTVYLTSSSSSSVFYCPNHNNEPIRAQHFHTTRAKHCGKNRDWKPVYQRKYGTLQTTGGV